MVSPKKRDFENEKFVLGAFLRHPICRKRLSDLTVNDFARYRDERLKTIISREASSSALPHSKLVRGEGSKTNGGLPIKENPIRKLKFKAIDRRRERRLNVGELNGCWKLARPRKSVHSSYHRIRDRTGMRRGEILAMRWDYLQEAHRALLVPISKNGRLEFPFEFACPPASEPFGAYVRTGVPHSPERLSVSLGKAQNEGSVRRLELSRPQARGDSRLFEKGLSRPEAALVSGHNDMRMLFRVQAHPQREVILSKLDRATVAHE